MIRVPSAYSSLDYLLVFFLFVVQLVVFTQPSMNFEWKYHVCNFYN